MTDLTATSTEALVDRRDEATEAYYRGESIMTDDAFDLLTAELTARGVEEQVGHGLSAGKTRHLIPMLSLRKVHTPEDVARFSDSADAESLVEFKWDGLAISVRFDERGELALAVTRGDGEKGDDVTAAVRAIFARQGLPTTLASGRAGEVRGEIVLRKSDLEKLNIERGEAKLKTYANTRNTASGFMGRSDTTDAGRWLTFVPWDAGTTGEQAFDGKSIAKLPASASAAQAKAIVEAVEKHATKLDISTDGVVFKVADQSVRDALGSSSTFPRWAIAYKFPNRPKETILRQVVWNRTRTGRVVPVAIFDAVELSGAQVTQATLNNVAWLEEQDLRIGDTISVTRANEVIPNVIGRVGGHSPDSTEIEHPVDVERVGRDYRVTDRNIAAEIGHALDRLDVLGLGVTTIEAVIGEHPEIDTAADLLLAAWRGELREFDGFKVRSIENLRTHAERLFSEPQEPYRWIAAVGVPDIGRSIGKKLALHFASSERFSTDTSSPFDIIAQLDEVELAEIADLDGVGESTLARLTGGLDKWEAWRRSLHGISIDWQWPSTTAAPVDGPLSGLKVLVTGTVPGLDRKAAQARVEELGGTSASSVSKTLDLLVVGDGAGGSKLTKAASIGIRQMTADEFASLS